MDREDWGGGKSADFPEQSCNISETPGFPIQAWLKQEPAALWEG